MDDHHRLIRMGEDLLNDSKFTHKSQCFSLSNMFFQNSRHRKVSGTLVVAPNSNRQQINVSHQRLKNVTHGGDFRREINMQNES